MERQSLVGRTIAGRFAIEALVGEGAMGAVYRARQLTLGTTLAVKVLHRWLAGEPMFAERFLREAQAASRVDHPSSMRVIDFGEEPDGLLYMATEYLDGRSLAALLDAEGPLPVERIVDIASQTLAALAVAHELGVIHRDLKPENIMVLAGNDDEGRPRDVVKVCDFGVAKLLEPELRGGKLGAVTAEGVLVGTPEYMSPEQARGEVLDARSDVYSMGVLLFQLMTGRVPFDAPTAVGTALMHVHDEPTRPCVLNPSVDAKLEAICLKAMQKRPDDRHASARELRAELRAILGDRDGDRDGSSLLFDASTRAPDVDRGAPAVDRAVESLAPSVKLVDQIERRAPRGGLVIAAAVLAASVVLGARLVRPNEAAAPVAHVAQETHETRAAQETRAVSAASAGGAAGGEGGAPSSEAPDAVEATEDPAARTSVARGRGRKVAARGKVASAVTTHASPATAPASPVASSTGAPSKSAVTAVAAPSKPAPTDDGFPPLPVFPDPPAPESTPPAAGGGDDRGPAPSPREPTAPSGAEMPPLPPPGPAASSL